MTEQALRAPARKLAFIHTVAGLVPEFESLAREFLPDWKPFAIFDESLLRDTIEAGTLSDMTKRRLAGYVWSAVDAGAEAVVVTCSTLGTAVDAIAPLCPVPLLRIDEGMAVAAVAQADRIGVLATLRTTLVPTVELLKRKATEMGKDVVIEALLVEGAFQRLANGDADGHDAQIRTALESLSLRADLVVFAQASMARALQGVAPLLPVLTSPKLGVANIGQRLDEAVP